MHKNPPKKINDLVGYRTPMSRKNMDTWTFAHEYCGKLWMKLGVVVLILSVIAQIPFVKASEDAIGNLSLILVAVQLAVIIGSVFVVEKALKNTFNEEGVRI